MYITLMYVYNTYVRDLLSLRDKSYEQHTH